MRAAVISGVAALCLAGTAGAQQRTANAEPGPATAPPEARAVDQLVTAARLAEWGRRAEDPQALIVAARMVAEVAVRPDTIEGRSEGGQPSERADPGQPSIQGLLEQARALAVGDGDTDIDMIVRDEFGEEVCEDRAYDHYPVCTVIPAFTGRFRVDIINRGRVWTRTQILSN